ncbi:MAG: hypothetical protein WCK24_05965, partial [Actinomycetes bacterium]
SSAEDNRVSYSVAAVDLASGSQVTKANVSSVKLDLQDTGNLYLSSKNHNKFFLKSPIAAGHLIPLSALVTENFQDCSAVIMSLGTPMSQAIKKGDLVDLWSAEQAASLESIPVQIVTAGELISIKNATDGFSSNTQTIEVCVSIAEIRSTVQAIAKKATVVAVRTTSQ